MSLRQIFEVVQSFNWMSWDIGEVMSRSLSHTHKHTHSVAFFSEHEKPFEKHGDILCVQCCLYHSRLQRNTFDVALYSVCRNENLGIVKFCINLYVDVKPFAKQHLFSFKYKLLLCQHRCHGNRWEQCNICLSNLSGKIIGVSCVTQKIEYGLFCNVYSPLVLCFDKSNHLTLYVVFLLSLYASSYAKRWYNGCENLYMCVVCSDF